MHLAGGIDGQTLAYSSQQFGNWSIVYWILPVKRGASNVYERVVLYVQNQRGVITETGGSPAAGTAKEADNAGSANAHQNVLVSNQDFLVAYAREMISDQANRSAALLGSHTAA